MSASSDDFVMATTDDGCTFQCSVAEVGAAREQRWLLIDANRQLYIGPTWRGDVAEPQLRALVNEWWQARKERKA